MVTGCAVTGIELDGAEVQAVQTSLGTVVTSTVICAAGVWSPEIARAVGVELPVQPYLREVGFTGPVPGLPSGIPLTVDFSTGFYFHREGPGLLFGMADPEQPPGFGVSTDPAWLELVLEVAERRCPALLDMGIAGGWKWLLRGHAGPQRARRRDGCDLGGSCTRPDSPAMASCRGRRSARSCATSSSDARRSSTSRRCPPSGSPGPRAGPSAT